MQIKSIKLTTSGLKGISVEYTESNKRDGREGKKITKDKFDHPIQLAMEKPFKDLRFHLLEICNIVRGDMDKKDVDYTILECEVTGIKIDGDGFAILGTKEVFAGKRFKIETPVVTADDEYEHYESVIALLATIVEETKLYMRGEAKVDNDELVVRWIRADKQKGFDIDSFNALSAEDKKELCQKILEESFGMVVMGGDDYAIEHVKTEEVTAEFKQQVDEAQVIEIELPEPVMLKK